MFCGHLCMGRSPPTLFGPAPQYNALRGAGRASRMAALESAAPGRPLPDYGLPALPSLPCPEFRGPTPWSNWVSPQPSSNVLRPSGSMQLSQLTS